uniref:Uncharacterized protein n=1 Tax=Arundo donax TaxID=35708 RepID=A0A0A8Y3V4_ARUDO
MRLPGFLKFPFISSLTKLHIHSVPAFRSSGERFLHISSRSSRVMPLWSTAATVPPPENSRFSKPPKRRQRLLPKGSCVPRSGSPRLISEAHFQSPGISPSPRMPPGERRRLPCLSPSRGRRRARRATCASS